MLTAALGELDVEQLEPAARLEVVRQHVALAAAICRAALDAEPDARATGESEPTAAVAECVALLRAMARAAGVELEVEFRPQVPRAAIGRLPLLRALVNLLVNAIRAARSRLLVTVGAAGGQLCIAVDDDGPGFPAEWLGDGPPPVAVGSGGHGIGLRATRDALLAAGGALRLARSALLGGARAELALPVGSVACGPSAPPVADPAPGARLELVVVEDDPVLCSVVTRILSAAGHRVRIAVDVAAARRALADLRDGGVLIDATLAGDVGALLAELAATATVGEAPRVIVTSGCPEAEVRAALRLGPQVGFLAKPFDRERLLQAIASLCATPPAGAEREP
ncbi:MAG: response regulator [Planctomycetes bacterium]|nr:response regulator [Planctomycetota bacterium]